MAKERYNGTAEHVLCKRIPTPPFGDVKDRSTVWHDQYVKTGGYQGLRKALDMAPDELVTMVKDSQLRGRGAGSP